jgi:hypothetical protein
MQFYVKHLSPEHIVGIATYFYAPSPAKPANVRPPGRASGCMPNFQEPQPQSGAIINQNFTGKPNLAAKV